MTKAHIIHSNTDLILNVLINLKLNTIKDRQYKKEERSQNFQPPAVCPKHLFFVFNKLKCHKNWKNNNKNTFWLIVLTSAKVKC